MLASVFCVAYGPEARLAGFPGSSCNLSSSSGPSCFSRGFPGTSANLRRACLNPRRALGGHGDAVNHHSLKTNFIPTNAGGSCRVQRGVSVPSTEVMLLCLWTLTWAQPRACRQDACIRGDRVEFIHLLFGSLRNGHLNIDYSFKSHFITYTLCQNELITNYFT